MKAGWRVNVDSLKKIVGLLKRVDQFQGVSLSKEASWVKGSNISENVR